MNGAGERFGEGLLTIYLIAASLCSVGQKGSERQQKHQITKHILISEVSKYREKKAT